MSVCSFGGHDGDVLIVSVCSSGVTMGCINCVGLFFWGHDEDVLIVSVCSSGLTMGCINSVGLFFWGHYVMY